MFTYDNVVAVARALDPDAKNPRYGFSTTDTKLLVLKAEEGFCRFGNPLDDYRTPSCVAGQIVNGVDPEVFEAIAKSTVGIESALEKAGKLDLFEPRAVQFLSAVQENADDGRTWGLSVQYSDTAS